MGGMPREMRQPKATAPPPDAASPWVLLRSATVHPFVYRKMVRAADDAARPGDIVHVYDKAGTLFGRGLYNPHSQIVVRMLTWGDEPVDDAFWRSRLSRALHFRSQLGLDRHTDAYRLVHAEGDELSGLIVERFADTLVFEPFSLGMFQQRDRILPLLAELLGPPTSLDNPEHAATEWRVLIRADARVERLERFQAPALTKQLREGAPDRVTIRENNIRFRVDFREGHKTGFFCDQRDNRRRFAALCDGADVLDLCCYTGGFSLAAKLLGNAREVTGVDLDEDMIAVAKDNANLNQTRIKFVYADVFTFLRQMLQNGRQFDAVVLDPPKLAIYRAEYREALAKYVDFNALAMQVVRPNGVLLTCSCSGLVSPSAFRESVHRAGQRAGRRVQLFDQTAAGPDHPVMLNCPESAYLKACWLRVL
jgi:23S rRNA (cytosine1962-C5)-methyltransferase